MIVDRNQKTLQLLWPKSLYFGCDILTPDIQSSCLSHDSDMIFFGRGSQTELPQTSERSNYSQRLIVRRYAKSRICKRQAIDYERKGTDIEDGRQLDREILSNGSAALYNRNTYLLTPQLLPADFNLLELPLCSLMD